MIVSISSTGERGRFIPAKLLQSIRAAAETEYDEYPDCYDNLGAAYDWLGGKILGQFCGGMMWGWLDYSRPAIFNDPGDDCCWFIQP